MRHVNCEPHPYPINAHFELDFHLNTTALPLGSASNPIDVDSPTPSGSAQNPIFVQEDDIQPPSGSAHNRIDVDGIRAERRIPRSAKGKWKATGKEEDPIDVDGYDTDDTLINVD